MEYSITGKQLEKDYAIYYVRIEKLKALIDKSDTFLGNTILDKTKHFVRLQMKSHTECFDYHTLLYAYLHKKGEIK